MRLLILVFAATFVLLQIRLWMSDEGMREMWRMQDRVERQTGENGELAARNAALEAEVSDLKRGLEAAEERARSELGMVRSDETFYQITPYHPDEKK
jgi:cell division protein FtsB